MKLFDVYPINDITITRGEGSYVWDDHGNRYCDFYGGHAVISIGHTHPHYVAAIKQQLDNIGFYSNSIRIPLQQQLADRLAAVSGKQDYQLFLCNSGAEANENAMKLASFHTGRKKIVAFSGAFHGRTSLAVSATDNPSISAPVNITENIVFLPFNDEERLSAYFRTNGQDIAGVIVEGIQGVGGIIEATPSFLQTIRSLCDEYGAVFIADSVQCGYGRTGKFFSHDHAGIQADIYSMAKGMGNGFPIGGILIAPHIQAKYGMLGTTFGGNHLACAAAIAVLEVMEKERLIKNTETIGNYLTTQLKSIDALQHVRGRGLMIGFDVPEQYKTLRKTLLDDYRIFTGEAKPSVIRLLPALNISRTEADLLLHAIRTVISEIQNNQNK
ncbi:aspartate aminotransferase family protein [Rurimicrobium arvi]|uniref:Aminotransferase class III-fold pyridoxal phosphate-dependent enzyme n=1 Tax=Rurimicrobium arvi TaxID=2049916 RepID=A0ABP8MU10_9BACT